MTSLANDTAATTSSSAVSATPDSIYPIEWTVHQVTNWLSTLSPSTIGKLYSSGFKENDVVGEALIQLDADALKDIGVTSVGHRLVILKGIYELKIKWGIEFEADDWRPTHDGSESNGAMTATTASLGGAGGSTTSVGTGSQYGKMANISIFAMRRALQERDERVRALELELARLEDWLVRWTGEMGNPSKVDPLHPYFPPSKVYSLLPDGMYHLDEYTQNAANHHNNYISQANEHAPSGSFSGPLTAVSTAGMEGANVHGDAPRSRLGSLSGPASAVPSSFDNNTLHERSPTSSAATPTKLSHYQSTASTSAGMASPTSAVPNAQGHVSAAAAIAAAASASSSTASPRYAPSSGLSSPLLGAIGGLGDGKKDEKTGKGASDTPYKSFRVTLDDPCHKVLPAALKKYKINDDWRQYALFICYGTTERCLSYDEKPLLLFQKLKEAKQSPVFMLRHIRDVKSPIAIASAKAAARKSTITPATTTTTTASGSTERGKLKDSTADRSASGKTSTTEANSKVKEVADEKSKKSESGYVDSPPGQPKLTGPASQLPDSSKTGIPTSSASNSSAGSDSFAIAIYPYVSEREDEFDVSVGDTFIVKSKAKGWWVVQRDAKASGQADVVGVVKKADGSAKNGGEIRSGWVPAGCLLETKKPLSTIVPSISNRQASPKTPSEGTFSVQQQRAPSTPDRKAQEEDANTPKQGTSSSSSTSSLSNYMANAPIPPSLITSTSTPGILLMDYHAPDENIHLKKDVRLRVFKRYNHWSYCVEEEVGHARAWLPSWYIGKVGSSRNASSNRNQSSSTTTHGSSAGGSTTSSSQRTAITGRSEAIPLICKFGRY